MGTMLSKLRTAILITVRDLLKFIKKKFQLYR
jgi:hypothetical protein